MLRGTGVLRGEDVRCNDKGFQIRDLELPFRGDTVWKSFVFAVRVPANPPAPPSHQASS